MKKPFISIIVPSWRGNKILTRCCSSLLVQDYPKNKFEIIIVLKENQPAKNKKIKIVEAGKNLNHAEMRNIGVAKAKGEILAFCDDDCILPKTWLSLASTYFTSKKVDLVSGPIISPKKAPFLQRLSGYLNGSRFTIGFAAPRYRNLLPEQEANEFDLILANTFVKRKAFEKFGGFDKNQVPCEENFLYAKLKKNNYKLFYSPKIACLHPAKPLFLPWAKKIYFYATGRGLLVARAPQTFHPQYLVPSLFVFISLTFLILSPFSLLARSYLLAIFFVYLFLNLINAGYVFFLFEKNPLIFVAAPVGTFLIHLSYGLGFFHGFVRYLLGKRQAIKMPSKD